MSKPGKAIYMTFAVLIIFLIFSSMIKNALFTAKWFEPENTILPVVFFSALIDFIVLVVLYSILHEVRLYHASFNDDITFLSGLAGIFIGWFMAQSLTFLLSILNRNNISDLAGTPAGGSVAVVLITIAFIVIAREILLRGFLYQYIAGGIGDNAATWGLSFLVAVTAGHLDKFSFMEFVNLFLLNVVLCYSYRMFRDLWLPTTISFTFLATAFFTRLPVRELAFLERANLLTGLEKSWFGNEVTVFAGLPATIVLAILVLIAHGLIKNRATLKPETLPKFPEPNRPGLNSIKDPYIRYLYGPNSHQ